jgi:NADPH:quinone reductase
VRAAVCRTYGPPGVVAVDEVPSPVLGDGQVRVRISAAAVNFPDILLVADKYQVTLPTPFVPGSEFVGTVEEVADRVQGIEVGDRVLGTVIAGAFAEEVAVSAEAVRAVPVGVDDHHAAAFGVAWRTAYHVLRSVAQLQAGDELVVLGAGGSVGLAAVRLGACLGASVTAVASSPAKLEAAAGSGAVNLIDHTSVDLRASLREVLPGGADIVIDPVGGDLAEPALRSLHWGGRFVTVGYASGSIPRIPLNLVLLKGIHILGFQFGDFARHQPEEMVRNDRELLDLLVEGRAVPLIGATFDLAEAAAALQRLAEGEAVGKVVVEVARPAPW